MLRATEVYRDQYGLQTARWVRLCRRSGLPWREMPTAMLVIYRESRGDHRIVSPCRTYWGLWQMGSGWWAGKFDPLDPVRATRAAAGSVRAVGWQHWPTAAP